MAYLGIILFCFWLLIISHKLTAGPKNRSFSYARAFLGLRLWYQNPRILLLLIALACLIFFSPLKLVYLVFALAAYLTAFLCGRNFWNRIGPAWPGLILTLSSFTVAVITTVIYFRM